jgi:hypothetical protein
MASASVGPAGSARAGNLLFASAAEHGAAAHPYLSSAELVSGPDASRNLADLVHFLCTVHGRHPGVIDHAVNRSAEPTARAWLLEAVDGFAVERLYLTKLAVAAGPLPSTPGAGNSDAVVLGQRHAVEMLAQSERGGCALGAALALTADWANIRALLDIAARRLGVETPRYRLSDQATLRSLADTAAVTPAVERALLFGAQQMLVQHFGLWDLLEARQQARAAA